MHCICKCDHTKFAYPILKNGIRIHLGAADLFNIKIAKVLLIFQFFYLILPTLKRVTIIVKKCDTLVTTKKKLPRENDANFTVAFASY